MFLFCRENYSANYFCLRSTGIDDMLLPLIMPRDSRWTLFCFANLNFRERDTLKRSSFQSSANYFCFRSTGIDDMLLPLIMPRDSRWTLFCFANLNFRERDTLKRSSFQSVTSLLLYFTGVQFNRRYWDCGVLEVENIRFKR